MDKLSNKLRLVRSQSMGVGMGVANSEKVSHMRRVAASSNTPPEGRGAAVVLLDERRLEILIQPRLYAGELLDLVANHCQLKEKEYFGLAVVDESGHYTWLQLDRKVLDHELPRKPSVLTVHFLVKFFIESISHLTENKTIELFYLQARNLIFRGTLEVEADIVFQLAALSLQASAGDFVDDIITRALIKKSPILPSHVLKEHSVAHCEEQVCSHYKKMKGQTRGQAVVNYMTIVESMPTYGVHYFEVYDKRQTPWWLGLSCRGIAQYNYGDRKVPIRVFPWKQLENLYFRDKKFSIEVHDAKRVVQTLSGLNLYEDAKKMESDTNTKDELFDAISDSTTQVSVSRRSFNPGSIHVYMWFGKTQGLTKCIWQSAISQHQFYLDRKQAKMRHHGQRTLKEIARDLTRSTASLSSASSLSNLSRSGSTHSLAICNSLGMSATSEEQQADQQSEESKRARMEMVVALKARREALEAKVKEKEKQLKEICIKEGELTGELPPEIPLAPGEPVPQIRRRVGTAFALSETLLKKPQSPEEELLASLELEYEIQSKITSAALKLASDMSASKSVRKQRKISYQQSQRKLKEIENKLHALKYYGGSKLKRKQPRPDGQDSNSLTDGDHQHHLHMNMMKVRNDSQSFRKMSEDMKRGKSVPDLDSTTDQSQDYDEEQDEVDEGSAAFSPRSCPSSPRKRVSNPKDAPDTISLDPNSPQRRSGTHVSIGGYVPSSVYLKSSYRAHQFPTLSSTSSRSPMIPSSSNAPLLATAAEMMNNSSSDTSGRRSATLPVSPFRNKYETFNQCDSPVGLYNCPQQRTSQAFSSLDDLDVLTAASSLSPLNHRPLPPKPGERDKQAARIMNYPVGLEAAAAKNAFPSLERSSRGAYAKKSQSKEYHFNLANRELPAIPSSPSSKQGSGIDITRSMEDLDSLEASGIRGPSKMHYREVKMNGDTMSDVLLNKLSLHTAQTHSHNLQNNEEYPIHLSPGSTPITRPSTSGHNILGIRPLDSGGPYPTSHTNAALLPGQTYPEPSAKPLPSIASLQDVFFHHHQGVSSHSISSSKPPTVSKNKSSDEPPPLFPKQYHQVVEQRRRSGLDLPSIGVPVPPRSVVSESPAVNRKVKPVLTSPIAPPLPPTSSSQVSRHQLNESFENVPSSPSKATCVTVTAVSTSATTPNSSATNESLLPGKYVPYRETTKPFEMSDFYKYSIKYRKASTSSLKSSEQGVTNGDGSDVHQSDSSRNSTASGSGSSTLGIGQDHVPNSKGNTQNTLGEDFSNEMIAWYNNAQNKSEKEDANSNNPATLV